MNCKHVHTSDGVNTSGVVKVGGRRLSAPESLELACLRFRIFLARVSSRSGWLSGRLV